MITSVDQYLASARREASLRKTTSRTAVATGWFSLFDVAGNPGAGVLAGTSTAAGVVPTDATVGTPPIIPTSGDIQLSRMEFGSSVACRIRVCDLLFKAGAYAFNANTALAGQPSFASRLPSGIYSNETEIWAETVTAATGNQTWNVTYLDQDGISSSTGAVGIGAAPTVGRMWLLPFASGDSGVQRIDNVTGGTGTAGTANILVLRPLLEARVKFAGDGDIYDLLKTGLMQIFPDSALFLMVSPDSTATGIPDVRLEYATS
jgi:hypothetical protein